MHGMNHLTKNSVNLNSPPTPTSWNNGNSGFQHGPAPLLLLSPSQQPVDRFELHFLSGVWHGSMWSEHVEKSRPNFSHLTGVLVGKWMRHTLNMFQFVYPMAHYLNQNMQKRQKKNAGKEDVPRNWFCFIQNCLVDCGGLHTVKCIVT
jgi:hypothetical protein